eukprot:jgi/Psemu1/190972/e_gw1.108.9.1
MGRSISSSKKRNWIPISEFRIGFTVRRLFDDGNWYTARVMTEPQYIFDEEKDKMILCRKVKYYADEQEEYADEDQLNDWAYDVGNDVTFTSDYSDDDSNEKGVEEERHSVTKGKKTKEEIRNVLIFKMGITEEDIDFALEQLSPPYRENEVINLIHKEREKMQGHSENGSEEALVRFNPEIGMRVRARSGGSNWYGRVTKGPTYMTLAGESKKAKFWEITFDDGTKEDYDWNELLRYRASRPIVKLDDCRGRTLYALELFAGEGIVSQEFSELKWSIKSIDNNPKSYATHILDIMKAKYRDIGFVPDFIWASPPCTTCSNLSGGLHRNCKTGEFEKTQDALEHNQLMAQMMYIMKWAKKRNPHLIVVIENPTGQMQNLPMMIEFMSIFGLHKATVHYCAFGRFDKKPTDLWTNDFNLHARLNKFRCSKGTCAYHNTPHPVGTRSHSHQFNAAAIPQKLAEEVAEYVNAKFVLDQISRLPKVSLSSEEEEEFDFCMSV